MTDAYPLSWPTGWPRTEAHRRIDGRSKFERATGGSARKNPITVAQATASLLDELRLLGATPSHVIISTNIELRLDGLPYSNRRAPEDPGVAVYFAIDGEAMVMARDEYDRVADNLRSLALAIEALRQLKRHGGGTMLKRAFTGFQALPSPETASPPPPTWWEVLGLQERPADLPTARTAWREALKAKHPDKGGTDAQAAAINAAYEQAKRVFGDG